MSVGRWKRGVTRVCIVLWGLWLVLLLQQVGMNFDRIVDGTYSGGTWQLVGAAVVIVGFILPGLIVLGIRWAASAFEGMDDASSRAGAQRGGRMSGSRVVGVVSLLVAAVMVLVPPYSGHDPETGQTRFAGFAPLWNPPTPGQYAVKMQALSVQAGVPYLLPRFRVDVTRLVLQLVALGLVAGAALVVTNRQRKRVEPQP